jgi:hypothetical protein
MIPLTTTGHRYDLESFDGGAPQTIRFIEKAPKVGGEPGELVTLNDGTTNEEVLKMLIDRLRHLNAKVPSRQSALALTYIEQALMWLENRTAERKARGVEGKTLA